MKHRIEVTQEDIQISKDKGYTPRQLPSVNPVLCALIRCVPNCESAKFYRGKVRLYIWPDATVRTAYFVKVALPLRALQASTAWLHSEPVSPFSFEIEMPEVTQ